MKKSQIEKGTRARDIEAGIIMSCKIIIISSHEHLSITSTCYVATSRAHPTIAISLFFPIFFFLPPKVSLSRSHTQQAPIHDDEEANELRHDFIFGFLGSVLHLKKR